MDLQDFIRESLLSIHSGVKEVNKKLTKNYDLKEKKNIFLLKPGSEKAEGSGIHFDIAVTAKQEIEKGKKGKFFIKVLGADLEKKQKSFEENVTRLQFTVDVVKWAGTYK